MVGLEQRACKWYKKKYGNRPVDIPKTIIKATEELGELAKGYTKSDIPNMMEEAADVVITMFHVVRGLGGSLTEEIDKKLKIINDRLEKKKR